MNDTLRYYANINPNQQFFVNITTVKGSSFKCAVNVEYCKTVNGRHRIMKIIEKIVYDKSDPVEEIVIDKDIEDDSTEQLVGNTSKSISVDNYSEESYEEESYQESSTDDGELRELVSQDVMTRLPVLQQRKRCNDRAGDDDYESYGDMQKRLRLERKLNREMKKNKILSEQRCEPKRRSKSDDEQCYQCFAYSQYLNYFNYQDDRPSESQEPVMDSDYIDNIPTYRGLVYTLYDLYLLRYARKRRNYRAFSYGATGFLLKHITTNNLLPGELRCKLSNYPGYNKFSKILRRKKREDIKGLQILRCIHILSRLGLG